MKTYSYHITLGSKTLFYNFYYTEMNKEHEQQEQN